MRLGGREGGTTEGNALGTKWLRAGGREEPIQHQRAPSAPGLLQAAAAPQPAALLQPSLVVKRLHLLRRQVEPAPPLFTLRERREDNMLLREASSFLFRLCSDVMVVCRREQLSVRKEPPKEKEI